ncbi:hypothetical protein SAMN02745247_01585 [Butyrivibrio hungatei DSM 14810]|uniref:Uncharacterized protein n=1 Tax=Butyrivibrio hungatei DSM 14810 TaxID=1121132 RepID=A0A1M7SEE9_9FIRM|nr:hypothetical protein [Butyrivibrio hungatei]SHN56814.1 hypothetical protein SAMN02745247_01585 [Butyrivibrio hungatei DSM 14810]
MANQNVTCMTNIFVHAGISFLKKNATHTASNKKRRTYMMHDAFTILFSF